MQASGNDKQQQHTQSKKNEKARYDSPQEVALDDANEMSFPNSDPIATSNITRIDKAPDTAPAAEDHQNHHKVKENQKK